MGLYWESIVFAGIAFVILYLLLNKYAFGPLFGIMEKRRQQVVGDLKQAEEDRAQASKYLEEQQAELEKARQEAFQLIEQARLTSSKQADELIKQANEEAKRVKEEALKEIENERNKAIAQLRSQVSAMSVLIASKIIEKQVDEQENQALIQKYLEEVGGRS